MRRDMWNQECEPVRQQHRGGPGGRRGGRGREEWSSWAGGPWGGAGFGWGGPGGTSGGPGGPPPWVAQLFGVEPERRGRHGHPQGGRGRPRARRGDVRQALLDVLAGAEEPRNGYQLIQEIAERTEGAWKPSPGSVYPTISQLQDEGLVEDAPTGRKAIQLTEEGHAWVRDHAEELAATWAPFEQAEEAVEEPVDFRQVKQVIGQTVSAIVQVVTTGTPDQREKALEVLTDTRRRLYGILAEGPAQTEEPEEDSEELDEPDETGTTDQDR